MFDHILSSSFCFQSIFSQLRLSPSLKKVLFATALGSVALALTAHQLKRRGRKRKQVTQAKDGQKTVGIPEALLKTGRPSSLKRGVQDLMMDQLKPWLFCGLMCSFVKSFPSSFFLFFSFPKGPFTGRQVMSPSSRSNDTMSGISSLAPSKHSSSSHSLASVSFSFVVFFFPSFLCHWCVPVFCLWCLCFCDRCESQTPRISLWILPPPGRHNLWWKSQRQQRMLMQRTCI